MHSDPFDNVYIVTEGSKTFKILPPYAEGAMNFARRRSGRWGKVGGDWGPVMDGEDDEGVVWCEEPSSTSPLSPLYRTVTITPGTLLYLPAGWHHSVSSTGTSVAYNYWYDRSFDVKWCMERALCELFKQNL